MTLLSERELNLCKWMQEEKIAETPFQAENIISGFRRRSVEFNNIEIDEAKKMIRLYRDWRKSGVYGESTQPCFDEASLGNDVPVIDVLLQNMDNE